MRGWTSDGSDALLQRIDRLENAIDGMERRGRFIIGNTTHLEALRELSALRAREGELCAAEVRRQDERRRRHAPAMEPSTRWRTSSEHRANGLTVDAVTEDGSLIEITWDDGCAFSFSATSPMHIDPVPLAA